MMIHGNHCHTQQSGIDHAACGWSSRQLPPPLGLTEDALQPNKGSIPREGAVLRHILGPETTEFDNTTPGFSWSSPAPGRYTSAYAGKEGELVRSSAQRQKKLVQPLQNSWTLCLEASTWSNTNSQEECKDGKVQHSPRALTLPLIATEDSGWVSGHGDRNEPEATLTTSGRLGQSAFIL